MGLGNRAVGMDESAGVARRAPDSRTSSLPGGGAILVLILADAFADPLAVIGWPQAVPLAFHFVQDSIEQGPFAQEA